MKAGRAISVLVMSVAVLVGGGAVAAEKLGTGIDPAVMPSLDIDPVIKPKPLKPPVVDPIRDDPAAQTGVPGTVGGGSGGRLPGGTPLPKPKKICPHGKTCAE